MIHSPLYPRRRIYVYQTLVYRTKGYMSEIENVGDSQDRVNGTLEFQNSRERIQSVVWFSSCRVSFVESRYTSSRKEYNITIFRIRSITGQPLFSPLVAGWLISQWSISLFSIFSVFWSIFRCSSLVVIQGVSYLRSFLTIFYGYKQEKSVTLSHHLQL